MDTSKLTDVMADLATRLAHGAEQYGPQAVDLTGRYLQILAILNLAQGAIVFAAGAWFSRLALRCFRIWMNMTAAQIRNHEECQYVAGTFGGGFIGGVLLGGGGLSLLQSSPWLAALSPKLALVQLAIQTVIKH